MQHIIFRFEADMLAFSGCYYGGGEKERIELSVIRKRWSTLHVSLFIFLQHIMHPEQYTQDRVAHLSIYFLFNAAKEP